MTRPIRSQLFIQPMWRSDAVRRGPMMARDAGRRRRVYDERPADVPEDPIAPAGNGDAITQIAKWASENLDAGEIGKLIQNLKAISPPQEAGAMTLDEARAYGRRFAQRYVARKTTTIAADAARDAASYAEMFPQAARIGHAAYCDQPQRRGTQMSSAAASEYDKMFPGASRIGHV